MKTSNRDVPIGREKHINNSLSKKDIKTQGYNTIKYNNYTHRSGFNIISFILCKYN